MYQLIVLRTCLLVGACIANLGRMYEYQVSSLAACQESTACWMTMQYVDC